MLCQTTNPMSSPGPTALRPALLAALGVLCVVLGAIGILVPGLPTTPFLLAASWLFVRSSPRLSAWLDGHPRLGPYLRAIREGRGIPRRAKVVTLVVLWGGLTTSVFLLTGAAHPDAAHPVVLAAPFALVGAGVSWFIVWRMPTSLEP